MRLRHLLALAFTVVATVPVVFLTIWVQQSAMKTELAMVREKHLLLAGNMTAALERYAADAEAAFELFVSLSLGEHEAADVSGLGRQLGFSQFRILDGEGRSVKRVDFAEGPVGAMPDGLLAEIRAGAGEAVAFSPVVNDSRGQAVIYLSRRVGADWLALAALRTDYIVALQQAIAFGRKGHAAIVDHQGNLIAHPNPQWTAEHKNIAKVEPVSRMMRGETGVTPFFSPAMQQDMVSGYTTAEGPGWGVMVPQPIGELEERAWNVVFAALTIGLVGLAAAAAIGWLLAGALTRPVQAVLSAARDIGVGRLDARVERQSELLPVEFSDLAEGFNGMAETIEHDKADLEQALVTARQADRAKTEFLAAMSHELRTPLNTIIGFAEVLRRDPGGLGAGTAQIEYLESIQSSGEQLLGIINDILDLSKIEAGLMEVADQPVESAQLVRDALALAERRPERAKVELTVALGESLPDLRGSEIKLRQVLVNLLSNAMKFTPDGGRVSVAAWRDEAGDLGLRIEDSGIGMSAEEVEIALTPFRQVDGSLSREHEGTGLGLPLAKRLVELHGGSLEIESAPGEGTRVELRLPSDKRFAQAA